MAELYDTLARLQVHAHTARQQGDVAVPAKELAAVIDLIVLALAAENPNPNKKTEATHDDN